MKKRLSLFLLLISVGLLTALAAGPVFGGNLAGPDNNGGFRALSGGQASDFEVPGDMELVLSYDLPAYGLTYERYQQFFGNAHAQVLGGQITLYKDRSGNTVTVIGNHYDAINTTNSPGRSQDNARNDVARDIGPDGDVKIDLMINPETGRFFHRVETQRKFERWFHWIDADNG